MKELFSKILTFVPNFNIYFSQPFSPRNKKTYSKFNLFHILEFIYLLNCIELAVYLLQKELHKENIGHVYS